MVLFRESHFDGKEENFKAIKPHDKKKTTHDLILIFPYDGQECTAGHGLALDPLIN
jgi:hypothetical protein